MKDDSQKPKKEEKNEKHKHDKGEVERLQSRIDELEEQYKRALADYQNLQRRSNEERIDWIRSANKELLLRILSVYDTLVLASKHVSDQGIQISVNQFLDVLKSEGVVKIEVAGKEFNPHTMEAIGKLEGEEGKVIEEVRTGFMIHDKLLRPAQVMVGEATKN